jgi:excisionase family DNA binding protein
MTLAAIKICPLCAERAPMTMIDEDFPRFLNVGEAAAYVGVSAASLRKWSNQGHVPVYRTPGGQRRFVRGDLDDFMRAMRDGASGGTTNGHNGHPASA